MKIKIFGGIALMAIAAAVAFNVSLNLNKSNNQLSLLALANVEALAGDEGSVDICEGKPAHGYGACYGLVESTCTKKIGIWPQISWEAGVKSKCTLVLPHDASKTCSNTDEKACH